MELYDDVKRTKEVCVAAELSFAATKSLRRVARDCGKRAAQAAAWTDVGDFAARWQAERSNQTALLRDIFGNPFRPVAFSLDWRTSTATTLASQMYESRDFSAMPILADALQDAGCDSADVLNHCRRPGAHVRGCWVVDLVLGKE
ncbi:hypothetical protein [Gemmata sp. SH-PL17]|uniref:hypothetical protein n=1 Tax=Gemmata sp. SH-PL17 TaxID=1630693 RepID=UPI0004BCF6E8|nr:hypothetical protein [Gemmata sp. SH-PL17]